MLIRMSATEPLQAESPATTRDLIAAYMDVRGATLALAEPLDPEDCVVQTIPEVSPAKWHLAHVTWFFERFCLLELDPDYRPFHDRFLELFNSYYHTVGSMHPRAERGLLNRPPLREVLAYRRHVDEAMQALIRSRAGDPAFEFLVTLGLNHEQQHQELLLTDIKHVFFTNPLHPAYRAAASAGREPEMSRSAVPSAAGPAPIAFIERPGGRFAFGHEGPEFCFDNETPRHDELVDAHEMADRLVTNAEYREFVEAGGYRQSQWWLSDGFSHIRGQGIDRPLYWSDDLERVFTLAGWQPVDPAAPVCHVSYYEADAFARFAGARLPTEFEWEIAARGSPVRGNTLDTGLMHPIAAPARTDDQPRQLWGDAWEWTASPYSPYPRFRPLAGSLGEYNGKFMANQMVVRGGSCVTWASHLRATYRSFFYPHDRWQFLGFRLVRDTPA